MTDLVIPEVEAIRQRFEKEKPAIRGQFERRLAIRINDARFWLFAGALAIGVLAVGSVLLALIKAAIALVTAGFVLAGLGILGIIARMTLPILLQNIAFRMQEEELAGLNRHLATMEAERDRRIEEIKARIRANPIGFLEREYQQRREFYDKMVKRLRKLAASVGIHVEKFNRLKADRPNMDLMAQAKQVERLQLFYKNRQDRAQVAHRQLQRRHEMIEEFRVKWTLFQDAQAALDEERRAEVDADQAFQDILANTAFDQINGDYEAIFAQLEVDAYEMDNKRLEFGPDIQINLDTRSPATVAS